MLETFFFDGWENTIRIVLMAIFIYIYLAFIMRMSGKRTLMQYNMLEAIITIAFGSAIATVLITRSVSFIEGVLVLGMLTLLQFTVGVLQRKSTKFESMITPTPTFLFEDGSYCEGALKKERVLKNEIRSAVRSQGIGSMNDVKAVILEGNGKMSIISKDQAGDMDTFVDVKHNESD